MADGFPSTYVDKETGEVKRLGSIWDKIESDGLLKGADYALTLGKMALLAPVLGVVAIATPLGVWVASRMRYNGLINQVYDDFLDQAKYGGEQYKMETPSGKARFDEHFSDIQPSFSDDYLKMVKMSGLKAVPTIIVREKMFTGWGPLSRDPKEYNAGAASRTNGTDATIEIGQGVIDQMTPGELRAIIGHEITHLALGHTKDRGSWLASKLPNTLLNVALIGAAAFGLVPFLPAVALVGVSYFAHKCLESVNSRRREEDCDRGAAILTGGTEDLAAGLRKLQDISKKALESQVKEASTLARMMGYRGGELKIRIKEPGPLEKFMKASHPTNERRAKLLTAFEEKYHAFCEKQRSLFANTFNTRARPRVRPKPAMDPLQDLFSGATVKRTPGGSVIVIMGRGPGSRSRGGSPF